MPSCSMKCVKVPSSVRCHSLGTPAAMFARLPGIVVSAQRLPFVSVKSLHSSHELIPCLRLRVGLDPGLLEQVPAGEDGHVAGEHAR